MPMRLFAVTSKVFVANTEVSLYLRFVSGLDNSSFRQLISGFASTFSMRLRDVTQKL
jgi:hypothetical protein